MTAVADLVPRIRRALEGVKPLSDSDPLRLTDPEAEAAAADAIGDLILFTRGQWDKKLIASDGPPATHWAVTPDLRPEEEALVARQAALTYFFQVMRSLKVTERIQNESQQWEYSLSANLMRDAFKALKEERDLALAAVMALDPVFARVASLLAVRDRMFASVIEPWTAEAGLGGNVLYP
jgi:hypothetical protein